MENKLLRRQGRYLRPLLSLSLVIFTFILFTARVKADDAGGRAAYTAKVFHRHTQGCYRTESCGGSCYEDEYMIEGCSCGPEHPCITHDCYWEDPNDHYPTGCWHCYCPKGKNWLCAKCHRLAYGPVCSYEQQNLVCTKAGRQTAEIRIDKSTEEWCKRLELVASFDLLEGTVSKTPYIWDGTPMAEASYQVTENGAHSFELQADENSDTATARILIPVDNIDVTGPMIGEYILEPAGEWTREPVALTVKDVQDLQPDGSSGCGLAKDYLSFEGGAWIAQNTFLCAKSGVYTLAARDSLENETKLQVKVSNVDVTGPEVDSITWEETPNLREVMVKVSASDRQEDGSEGSGLSDRPYSYDGGQTWIAEPSHKVENNGVFRVLVKDKLGNIGEGKAIISNLDKTPPRAYMTVTPQEWYGQGDVTLTVVAEDDGIGLDSKPFSWDNGHSFTSSPSRAVSESGLYRVLVRDRNGNTSWCEGRVNRRFLPEEKKEEDLGGSQEAVGPKEDISGNDHVMPETETAPEEATVEKPAGTKAKITVKKNGGKKRTLTTLTEERPHNLQEDSSEEEKLWQEEAQKPLEVELAEPVQPAFQNLDHHFWGTKTAKVLVVTVSGALLLSVTALLLYLLLMGIRVYNDDGDGRYRYLGLRLSGRREDYFILQLSTSLEDKARTNRYRLYPGRLFAMLNKGEEMLVETAEQKRTISVRIDEKIELHL